MSERIKIATFDGIQIPHIDDISEEGDELADVGRTAGGFERSDTVRAWREWSVRTAPMPEDVANQIRAHLRSIGWGYGDWWCYLMEGQRTVRARIPRESFNMTLVLGARDRRTLSFRVVER